MNSGFFLVKSAQFVWAEFLRFRDNFFSSQVATHSGGKQTGVHALGWEWPVARAGGGQVVEMLSSWNSGSSRSLVNLAVCHGT